MTPEAELRRNENEYAGILKHFGKWRAKVTAALEAAKQKERRDIEQARAGGRPLAKNYWEKRRALENQLRAIDRMM